MKNSNKIKLLMLGSLVGFVSLAANAQAKIEAQPQKMSHWTISVSAFDQNFHINKLTLDTLGYEGKVQYAFSKYFYGNVSAQRDADHKWQYGVTGGAIYPGSHFSPYGEVSYNASKDGENSYKADVNYDAGLYWHLPKKILPGMSVFVEFDNFARHDNYMTYGVQYMLTKKVALSGEFSYNQHENCKQAKAILSYTL